VATRCERESVRESEKAREKDREGENISGADSLNTETTGARLVLVDRNRIGSPGRKHIIFEDTSKHPCICDFIKIFYKKVSQKDRLFSASHRAHLLSARNVCRKRLNRPVSFPVICAKCNAQMQV